MIIMCIQEIHRPTLAYIAHFLFVELAVLEEDPEEDQDRGTLDVMQLLPSIPR